MRLFILAAAALLSACSPSIPSTYKHVKNKVVKITYLEGGGGSGFAVEIKGKPVIITNAHVCQGQVMLLVSNGDVTLIETVIQVSKKADLCAITNHNKNLSPLATAAREALPGETVFAAGHPFLNDLTVTEGHVVGTQSVTVAYQPPCKPNDKSISIFFGELCLSESIALNTTSQINPGNSGGPLVNSAGEVTGVMYAGGKTGNYAVPLQQLKNFLVALSLTK